MPPVSNFFAAHSRQRLARYLGHLIEDNAESKNKVGSLVGVTANRVTRWVSGSRSMSAETAFELGDALRAEFGWETSGIELLWACGYWPDVLAILKYLAADSDGGPVLTAKLYSWLPRRMFDFEVANIEWRLREKLGVAAPRLMDDIAMEFDATMPLSSDSSLGVLLFDALQLDPGAREVLRYARDRAPLRSEPDGDRHDICEWLDSHCSSTAFQAHIARAWERYQNSELAVTHGSLGGRAGTSAALLRIEIDIIDALIEAARNLHATIFPSYAIPKIWRMLAGWVYEIDERAAAAWAVALPDNFVNIPDVSQRNAAERELEERLFEADGRAGNF